MKHITGSNRRNLRALRRILPVILLICSLAFTIIPPPGPAHAASTIERVNVSSAGVQGNDYGSYASISDDGRYVVFSSMATNLVAVDTNGYQDVFVRDRTLNTTTIVSVSSSGVQGTDSSGSGSISEDGRYVAFASSAKYLVSGDNNNDTDIFVRDLALGTTTRVSLSYTGAEGNSGSTGTAISWDGRYVAFSSMATNLVAAVDDNGYADIFIRDTVENSTTRVNLSSESTQANAGTLDNFSISDDGYYVAFVSYASNLVPGDYNGWPDVFVRDVVNNATTRVSVSSAGVEANDISYDPSISGNGRYVTFSSAATNLVGDDTNGYSDVFVHDRVTHTTTRVSVDSAGAQGDFPSEYSTISRDGRYVAFESGADNLVPGDNNFYQDIFVRDRTLNTTTRVSLTYTGGEGNNVSSEPHISDEGGHVAFLSRANNLVPSDTNGYEDIFVVSGGCTKPGAPTLTLPASAACASGTSATFTWAAGTGSPTKYMLQVSANPAFTGANIYYAQVNATSQLVTVLPNNGGVLYWRVLSGNACGWGAWSARRAFYNGKPGTPTLSTPAAGAHVANTSVTFTWAAGTGTPANYFLQVSTSPTWAGPNKYYAMVSGTSKVVTGFPNNGTVYYWRVTAGNTCGWSLWSARRAIINGP